MLSWMLGHCFRYKISNDRYLYLLLFDYSCHNSKYQYVFPYICVCMCVYSDL